MLTADFDYDLPPDRIAQFPVARGESRLLVLFGTATQSHRRISDLPTLLRSGDLLVVNNTRVIPARLLARRPDTGGRLEILLVDRLSAVEWSVMARPGRRAKAGVRFELGEGLWLEVMGRHSLDRYRIRLSEPIEPHLERIGHVPLPPYIRRPDRASDRDDYQTVFARSPGAVAAPTAGLHFTPLLLERLRRAGVTVVELTLHVGVGTFKPVTSRRIEDHRMDAERFEISASAAAEIERTRRRGGRVVAVGTTVARALEAVASATGGPIESGAGTTDLFITPGFRFRVVELLLTNFHLPRSTLLMLVCALGGRRRVLDAYRAAVAADYRFYSYGDAMLVERLARGGDGSGETDRDQRLASGSLETLPLSVTGTRNRTKKTPQA